MSSISYFDTKYFPQKHILFLSLFHIKQLYFHKELIVSKKLFWKMWKTC